MRYLRKLVLNRRAPGDDRVSVDLSNGVVMNTTNNLLIPKGETAERPAVPVLGMMRYNTTTNEVEVYQGLTENTGIWRSIRYKESTGIVIQSLGFGDALTTIFGPLDPLPPEEIESGSEWSGANLLILVENVVQVFDVNYTIVGSYVHFTDNDPVPDGVEVIAIHGFDR